MPESRGLWPACVGVVLLLATWGLYQPGLGGPLILDDNASIAPLLALKTLPPDWIALLMSPTGPLGRPVSMLSFLANLRLHGDDLAAWKATNLVLHLVIGMVLAAVAGLMFRATGVAAPRRTWFALGLAGIWLLHPLHPSTVLYTVQRMTQLSALFTVAGVGTYLVARLQTRATRTARLGLWVPYLVWLPLAALSKETGVLLPAYLLLMELTILRETGLPTLRRDAHRMIVLFCVVPAVVVGGVVLLDFDAVVAQAHLARGFTFWQRWMTESRVMVEYLAQVVIPSRQQLGFFHDDMTLSTGLTNPPATLAALSVIAALLGAAWHFRRRAPLISFGLSFFLVGHSLEAVGAPLELMFEHRNYLPSFGLLLAIVALPIRTESPRFIPIATAITVLLALAFGSVTRQVVDDWRNEANFFSAAYQLHPRSPTAASQMAELLTAHRRFELARRVLAPIPGAGARVHRAFLTCRERGELPVGVLTAALLDGEKVLNSYIATGLIEIANLGLDDKCRFESTAFRELLQRAITLPTGRPRIQQKLAVYAAHFAWREHRNTEAFTLLERALALEPRDPMPLFLATEWKLKSGDIAAATTAFSAARRLARQSLHDYSSLVTAVRDLPEWTRAEGPVAGPATGEPRERER